MDRRNPTSRPQTARPQTSRPQTSHLHKSGRIAAAAFIMVSAGFAFPVSAAAQGGEILTPQPRAEAASADDRVDHAIAFTQGLMADATAALLQEDASEAEKLEAFQAVLAEGLALETMGRFLLGESRKTITDEQTARYEAIFPDYITRLYAEQFADIVGRPLDVIDSKVITARDVIVRTRLNRTDASPINVDWRIRQLRSGEQKAIDITVSGVSIMVVKREEFSAFVAQNGIDALIAKLEADAGR